MVRTSNPSFLPTANLSALCAMGVKVRLGLDSSVLDASSKASKISSLIDSVHE